jgi:hypothetical protein
VLFVPRLRQRQGFSLAAAAAILLSVLVDKGLCLVSSGFVPSPLGYVRDYRPTLVELGIVAGIYAGGALVFVAACRWLLVGHVHDHDAQFSEEPHALNSPSTARAEGMAKAAQLEN